MVYTFAPMDEVSARRIAAWRYDEPYAVYNMGDEDVPALLDPRNAYHAIRDDAGEVVAYACFGPDARVPGGDDPGGALEIGLGLVRAIEVISVVVRGDILRTLIRPDLMPSQPIAPASLRSLPLRDVAYELHKVVGRNGLEVTFETYGATGLLPHAGIRYAFQPWWSADQLALARDSGRTWRREGYTPSDAVAFRRRGGTWLRRSDGDGVAAGDDGGLVPGGWDHEHCALCWATISPRASDQRVGHTGGSRRLCTGCYERFIASGLGPRLRNDMSIMTCQLPAGVREPMAHGERLYLCRIV